VRRCKQRRADCLLHYRRDFPLAVVEAKEVGLPAEPPVQQAREYAEMLGLKFANATNGHRIIEIDCTAGTEREVDRYASPGELWQRLTAATRLPEPATAHLTAPFHLVSGKVPRHDQQIASNASSKPSCSASAAYSPRWPRAPARPVSRFRFAGSSVTADGTAPANTAAPRSCS
jgi:type I site-specific restriction endonuclease